MPPRQPAPGDILISRDPRDNGKKVEVYGVSDKYVYIRTSARKTRVQRRNIYKLYKTVEIPGG